MPCNCTQHARYVLPRWHRTAGGAVLNAHYVHIVDKMCGRANVGVSAIKNKDACEDFDSQLVDIESSRAHPCGALGIDIEAEVLGGGSRMAL